MADSKTLMPDHSVLLMFSMLFTNFCELARGLPLLFFPSWLPKNGWGGANAPEQGAYPCFYPPEREREREDDFHADLKPFWHRHPLPDQLSPSELPQLNTC